MKKSELIWAKPFHYWKDEYGAEIFACSYIEGGWILKKCDARLLYLKILARLKDIYRTKMIKHNEVGRR